MLMLRKPTARHCILSCQRSNQTHARAFPGDETVKPLLWLLEIYYASFAQSSTRVHGPADVQGFRISGEVSWARHGPFCCPFSALE